MAKGSTNAIIVVGGGGASSFTVPACSNVTARSASGKIYIKWTDPDNIYDGGKLISWTKSEVRLIVASDSSSSAYPKKVTDGTLVGTFTTKNQYKTTELEFTPPSTIGSDVNCCIMVYAHCSIAGDTKDYVNGEYKAQSSAQFKIESYSTWTVVIDESNSNPLSCCTYADDAVGMTKGSDEWDTIFGYRPCVFKDGAVYKYLNPNDFTKFKDGSDATSYVVNNSSYNVMIEFPRMGLNMSKSGDKITISLTNDPSNSSFEYRAHKRGSVAKNAFYLGAYESGYIAAQSLSSSSGVSLLIGNAEDLLLFAKNSGTGYDMMAFYQWTYVQALYILKYGNLNSQNTVGAGFTGLAVEQSTTGSMNTNGMNYGSTSVRSVGMKLFGLENLWGNYYKAVCGIYLDGSGSVCTVTDNFRAGRGTAEYTQTLIGNYGINYIKRSYGSQNGGFIPFFVDGSGSSTTYYCDYSSITMTTGTSGGTSGFLITAGLYDSENQAGIFYSFMSITGGTTGGFSVASRLMYL